METELKTEKKTETKTIQSDIRKLVQYGVITGLVPEEDVIFTTNRLLELFGLEDLEETDEQVSMQENELEAVLKSMCDYACEVGLIEEDSIVYRDLLCDNGICDASAHNAM